MPLMKFFLASFLEVGFATPLPSQMHAVLASGTPCERPDWNCISEEIIDVPHPGAGQMLVRMKGASVNLITVELMEPLCKSLPFPCSNGTVVGSDGSGVVVEMGKGKACDGVVVGDEVWMLGGQYAEYAIYPCGTVGLKPKKLTFGEAGTTPTAAATSLQCMQATNMSLTNLTVVVTRGGGAGFWGVQLAKALGASQVITTATGKGIDVMKKAGADIVIDYKKEDLFDVLGPDSVDVVYDNLGLPGTADKAMPAIRSGGVFMILSGGNGGKASDHPKSGVRQVPSCRTKEMGTEELDTLAKLFDAGKLEAFSMLSTTHIYLMPEFRQAFTWVSHYNEDPKYADDWNLQEVQHFIKLPSTTSYQEIPSAVTPVVPASVDGAPCCKKCELPLIKYYSVDRAHGFCGDACMDPKKFSIYKKFEANLTLVDDENPDCSGQYTPDGKFYTDYDSTVTHGDPFGILAVTLDLYAPTGMPDHSCCETPLPFRINCIGKPKDMTIRGTGPYCCPATSTEEEPCKKEVVTAEPAKEEACGGFKVTAFGDMGCRRYDADLTKSMQEIWDHQETGVCKPNTLGTSYKIVCEVDGVHTVNYADKACTEKFGEIDQKWGECSAQGFSGLIIEKASTMIV